MMTLVLAISGKKQSGKTTWVNRFEEQYKGRGWDVRSYSFADPLKEFLINSMGLEYNQCHGTDAEKNSPTIYQWETLPKSIRAANGDKSGPMSGRELMQIFGTDVMRQMFDDCIWVNATFRSILRDSPDIALIPDTRFPSELRAIYANAGYVIRLTRNVYMQDHHPSEIALDDWDWAEEPSTSNNSLLVPDDMGIEETWRYTGAFIDQLLIMHGLSKQKV